MLCPKCGLDNREPDSRDRHMCVECAKAENSRLTYYRQHQDDWMTVAKNDGIDVWLQQPGETQWEYTVWSAYRDSYPGKRPTTGDVARQLGTTTNVVSKIAQRWSFQARMQAWMAECDRITLTQRRTEILDMNKAHIDMAARLRTKLSDAIDRIDPGSLRPGEIASLAKMANEMERKARVDTIAQEEMRAELSSGNDNPELRRVQTKQSDLSEVVQILLKAGAFGEVGVKQTTEVSVKDAMAMRTIIDITNDEEALEDEG